MITWRSIRGLLAHPGLWPVAVATVFRLAPKGWWRRSPFVPLPDADYLHFRMVTAYGGDGSTPADPEDLVTYLRWCRAWPSVVRGS